MRVMGRVVVALTAVALALALTSCVSGTEPGAREPATGDNRTGAAGAETVEADDGSSRADGVAGGASCAPDAFLPLLEGFDNPDLELIIDDVDVANCRNGYARVYAIPRENPTGHPQHESEQVFLRDVGGTWEVVESGTGISCSDRDLSSQLLQVCDGLGER